MKQKNDAAVDKSQEIVLCALAVSLLIDFIRSGKIKRETVNACKEGSCSARAGNFEPRAN